MDNYGTVVLTGGAGNLPATNELPVDMHKKTMDALVSLTPITSILTRLGEDKARNFRVDWQEVKEIPHTVTVATTESAAGTSVSVISGGLSLVDDTLLYNPRVNDLRRINNGNSSSNDLTVAIDQGGTTSSIWKSSDVIHVTLPAVPEDDNDVYRTSSVSDSNVYNFTQLVRLQFSMTRTMNAMTTHFGGPGSKRQQLKSQKYREFRIKWEKLLYFGGRATFGTSPSDQRLAGGLNFYLRDGTLYKDFNGILTESGWDNYLLEYHEENPDTTEITAFIAAGVAQKISYFGKNKIRISPLSKLYGLAIDQYKVPGLTVHLVELPLFNDIQTRGWGFLLDTTRIRLKNLEGPMFFPEAKNVGQSELIYDTYRVSTSLMVANESRHSMFVGADL